MINLRKFIFQYNFNEKFVALASRGIFNFLPDEVFLKRFFDGYMGYPLDLDNPKTFQEKIQWLKLYYRKPILTTMVDKIAMKDYVAKSIGKEYVIPLVKDAIWNNFNEINFDLLPNQFVLKCNHDSGSCIICKDKRSFDYDFARKTLNQHVKYDYSLLYREWAYKNIKPKIFAESFLLDKDFGESQKNGLSDYKLFCFNGEPFCFYVNIPANIVFYDLNWNRLDAKLEPYSNFGDAPRPKHLKEMLEIAKVFAKDFPFLRVDFYEREERPLIGEFTFYPGGGFDKITSSNPDLEKEFSDRLILPDIKIV